VTSHLVKLLFKPIQRLLVKFHLPISPSLAYWKGSRCIDVCEEMDYIRLATLDLIASEIRVKIPSNGAVAELGVYRGDFAKMINEAFPDRLFYLFDTFEGFDEKNVHIDRTNNYSSASQDFSNTSVEFVLKKMPHPEMCIIRKGFFPNTATNLDERFVFVSIDADLFEPIYNGLTWFYPRLCKGGYIFVHDYANDSYKGAGEAVRKFCAAFQLAFVPIPDLCGTAIIGK